MATLTSVVIGVDTSDPDETLVVSGTEQNVYLDPRHRARLVRTDGGTFGTIGTPVSVHVTYDTQDDLPDQAAAAVYRGAVLLYESRATVGAVSERLGGYSIERASSITKDTLEQDAVWSQAVASLREIHL